MWIGVLQLNQLKYRSGKKRSVDYNVGSSKVLKSQQPKITDAFMKKNEEVLIMSLASLVTIITSPSQMFHVFETLMMLQESFDKLKDKKDDIQKTIYELQEQNLNTIIEHSTTASEYYDETLQHLLNVDTYMKNYMKTNTFSKIFDSRKPQFDATIQNVKEIAEIMSDDQLFDDEEDVPSTPKASTSGNPTTPGSGHSRETPLSWSIYKKNKPAKRASPQNKWSPLNPNKVSNTIVKTPSKAFDLSYFSVVLYELEENESEDKKKYWSKVLSNPEYREKYFSPVHPHQILQASTLEIWDWEHFEVHQVRTIQHFSFLLSTQYSTPTDYQDNLNIFLEKFSGDDQIDEACKFCQWCENQEPQPLSKLDNVIKYIFENKGMIANDRRGANFRSFLPNNPLEWLLVDDNYDQSSIESYDRATFEDYELVYKIFHNTNFGEYIHENSVKEFVIIYDYYYTINLESNREMVIKELKTTLKYVDDDQPMLIQEKIQKKTDAYYKFKPKSEWELFQKLSECFI